MFFILRYLAPRGAALRNLASLTHISVAGGIATASHGSGKKTGNLLHQIREVNVCF